MHIALHSPAAGRNGPCTPARLAVLAVYAVLCALGFDAGQASVPGQRSPGQPPARRSAASPSEARAHDLKLALQEDPLDARSHFLLGCELARQGDDDQAIIGFQRSLSIDPTHPPALHNLGTMLLARGEAMAAAELLEQAVALRPEHVPSYNSLAKAYFVTGLPELAGATYAEALRLDPADPVANRNLALIKEAAGIDIVLAATASTAETKAKEYDERIEALETRIASGSGGATNEPPAPGKAKDPTPPEGPAKDGAAIAEDSTPPEGPAKDGAAQAGTGGGPSVAELRQLLTDLPNVKAEQLGGRIVLTGWTGGEADRALLDRIVAASPGVLDLTRDNLGDPQRMIEIDAVLFITNGQDRRSIGFNFLRAVDLSFKYTKSDQTTDRETTGQSTLSGLALDNPAATTLTQGGVEGAPTWASEYASRGDVYDLAANSVGAALSSLTQESWAFGAAVDYVVNIANAADERVSVLARPHLTTLSGTPASFLAGGEIVFRVQGIESGDIKPYPFGTSVTVTPTLLRTPGEDGAPRVHIAVEASRSSVLEFLTAISDDDSVIFDRLLVTSEAVLDLDQTLILSGLNQRETRSGRSGVPILRDIPVVMDAQNRRALDEFVRMRKTFLLAVQGTEEDMRRFRERYPDWERLPPNRYASHFFLATNTELYRKISGEDLVDEELDLTLMGEVLEEEGVEE